MNKKGMWKRLVALALALVTVLSTNGISVMASAVNLTEAFGMSGEASENVVNAANVTDASAEDANSESDDTGSVTETASYTATSDTTVTAVTLDGSGDEADAAEENSASESVSDGNDASEGTSEETADAADGENLDAGSADTDDSEDAAEVLYCASAPDGSDIDDAVLYVDELVAPQYASDSSEDASSDAETYQNFTYSTSDGEAAITGYVGEETEIVIPDTITVTGDSGAETFTVTSIAAKAFYQNTELTKVTLSDNVVTIGDSAFYQCTALETVVLSENLTTIGQYAFSGCSALAAIDLTSKINTVGTQAFAYCTSLTSICIPKEMNEGAVTYTYTKDSASAYGIFRGCTGLETVTFEEGITYVHAGLFAASGVQKVVLPDTVTSINSYAFANCTALTEINSPASLMSLGDYAFYKTEITSFEFPEGMTDIGAYAFYSCGNLAPIAIPDSVTSIGSYAFGWCESLESIVIPESVTSIGEGVFSGCTSLKTADVQAQITTINASTFANCSSLESVTIPDTVTAIKSSAFSGCSSLDGVVLPEGVSSFGEYVFYNCKSLTSIVLPDSLTSMGAECFYHCTSLASVTISEGLTTLKKGIFTGCSSLTEIVIPAGITETGSNVFHNCTSLKRAVFEGSALTSIGDNMFYNCTALTEVVLPSEQTFLGDCMFEGCTALTEIDIPETVTDIGSRAFFGCTGFTEFVFPENLVSIGNSAFHGCTSLTEITLPDSVTSIGSFVFDSCSSLAEVSLPEGLTSIGAHAFGNCTAIEEITIPESVTSLDSYAFYFCTSLTGITIPESITSLSDGVFSYCTALTEVNLPDTLTEIGDNAFSHCTALTEMTIPGSVTSIGDSAFRDCSSLTEISLPANLESIGNRAFQSCTALTEITLPDSLISLGKYAFSESALTEITIPGSVTSLESYTFDGCVSLEKAILCEGITTVVSDMFSDCSALTTVELPETVTVIDGYAFSGCTALNDVNFPSKLESIGASAFVNCESLTEVILPNTVTSLGSYVFAACTSLASVELSDNLLSIDYCAFYHCTSLTELYIPISVESMGSSIFQGDSDLVLYVYTGSVAHEYAVENSLTYKLLSDCSLTVDFDGIDSWSDYAGTLIVAASDDLKVSKRISTATSYTLTGLISGDEYTVAVTNAYGDEISSVTMELEKGENAVTFTELAAIADVAACVYDADGNDVTDKVTVTWTEEDATYAVGSSLTAVPVGTTLSCSIRLGKALGLQYETPDAVTCTVTADGAQVTFTLTAFRTVTLTGTVLNESGTAISGAAVTATQELNGYSSVVTALSGSDGSFSVTVYAADAQLAISAGGYRAAETEVTASTGNTDVGTVTLEKLSGPKISLQVTYRKAAKAGATASVSTLYSFDNVSFSIENETTGSEVTEYSLSGRTLVLAGDEASAGDKLAITLSSPTDDFDPVSVTVTVGSDEKASLTAALVQKGSVSVTWASAEDGTVAGFVYDETGKQVYNTVTSYRKFSTGVLSAGTYTVILAGYNEEFVYPQSLSAWQSLGLTSGTDYLEGTVTVADGAIVELSFDGVPAFEVESFSYLDLEQSSFTSSKSEVVTGSYVTLRAKAVFKEEYAERAQDVKWIIELSDNSSFLSGTLSISGQSSVEAVSEDGVLEISVDDPSAMTRFCVLLTETGEANAAAYLEFTLDGETYRQAVGSVTVTCSGLDFTMSEKTNVTTVTVSGTGVTWGATVKLYDNDTLVGQTEARATGGWSATFELYEPYTYTTHSIYAVVTTNEGITYRTETKQLIYQYMENPVAVSKVTMINHSGSEKRIVFTFDGSQAGVISSYVGSFYSWGSTFTFLIEFEGEDLSALSNVQITVSRANGKSPVTLDAVYDETQNCYVAAASFSMQAPPTGVAVSYDVDQELIFSDEEMEAWVENVEAVQEDLEKIEELGSSIDSLAASGDEDALACLDAKESYEEALEDWQDALKECYGEVTETEDGFVIENEYLTISNTVNYNTEDLSGYTSYSTTGGNTVYVSESESSLVMISGGTMTTVSMNGDLDSAALMQEALDRLNSSASALSDAADAYNSAAAKGDYSKLAGEILDLVTDLIPIIGELKAIEKQLEDFKKLDDIWADGNCEIRKECNYYKGIGAAYIAGQVISLGAEIAGAEISPVVATINYCGSKLYDKMYEENLRRLKNEAKAVPAGCDCGQSGCLCGCSCDVCPGGDEDPLEGWENEPMFYFVADNTCNVIIDPSGYVYEAVLSNRLEGVTTTIYQKETLYDMYDEPYEQITLWDAAEYGQENPLTTNSEGEYAWDVPEGLWRVVYEKEGYVTEQSDWMEVPPPQLDVNVGLVSYEAPVLEKVLAYTDGVEITFSKYMQTETLTADNITVKVNGSAVEGTFEMTNEEENPDDESETFTSIVTFVPTNAIATGATVTVEVSDAAVSYAGTSFAGEAVTAETVLRPESFTVDESASVVSGETVEVTIQALPAEAVAGVTVTVANQTSLLFTVEETEVTLDEEGKATVHVTGCIIGESVIIFTLGDTGLTAETVVSVSMATPSITRSEVAAGNIDASLITAIAGSRDAEQISFTGSYDLSNGLTLAAKSGVTGDKALLLQEDDSADAGLVLIDFCMIDSDGNITFTVEDAVDSVIVYGTNGDVTGDGVVNASDTLAILRGVSGRTTLDAVKEGFADVNLDGVVNSNDLLAVVKYVSGRTSSLN